MTRSRMLGVVAVASLALLVGSAVAHRGSGGDACQASAVDAAPAQRMPMVDPPVTPAPIARVALSQDWQHATELPPAAPGRPCRPA